MEMAAAKVGVPLGTARRWRGKAEEEGDDWDRARAAHSLSTAGTATVAQMVLSDFITLHLATMEEIKGFESSPLEKAKAL